MQKYRVFRSLSCSQSIRQRIRRRTVTLYCNLHWNSQILVQRSQDWSNLTSFHHCVELRFSNAQGCLKSESRFHSVIARLSHQSRRVFFSRLDLAAKSLSTKTDFVNAFLVFDISMQICVSQPDIALLVSSAKSRMHEVHAFAGPGASRFLKGLIRLGSNMKVSSAWICIALHLLSLKSNSFYRLQLVL